MTCTIVFSEVKGYPGPGTLLAYVRIAGIVSPSVCDIVTMHVTCDGVTRLVTAKVLNAASGYFSVDMPRGPGDEHPCGCGQPIKIEAECVGSSQRCTGSYAGPLECVPPDSCPSINAGSIVSFATPCDSGGNRTVFVYADINPPPGSKTAIWYEVTLNGAVVGQSSAPGAIGPASLGKYFSLSPGSYPLEIKVYRNGLPDCPVFTTNVPVPDCTGIGCGNVIIDVTPGDCSEDGKALTIDVTASVTPFEVPMDAALYDDASPTPLDSKTMQNGPFQLIKTGYVVPAGTPRNFHVAITNPEGCKDTTTHWTPRPCNPGQTTTVVPPKGSTSGGGSDDENGGLGCLLIRYAAELAFALSLFFLLIALCVPGAGTWLVVAAGASAAAGAALFAVWWLLCGTRCGTLALFWELFVAGAWISAFLSPCCPLSFILTFVLAIVGLVLFFVWLASCRPTVCKIFLELTWVHVAAVGTGLAWLTKIAPCGWGAVPIAAAVVAMVCASIAGGKCK